MSAIGMVVRSVCLVAPIGSGLAASVSPAPTTCSPSTGDIISFMAGASFLKRPDFSDPPPGGGLRLAGGRRAPGAAAVGRGEFFAFWVGDRGSPRLPAVQIALP